LARSAAIAGGENPKAVAKVLMTMYEQDQVEEEVVLAWHGAAICCVLQCRAAFNGVRRQGSVQTRG
jgi:hypothetical protein